MRQPKWTILGTLAAIAICLSASPRVLAQEPEPERLPQVVLQSADPAIEDSDLIPAQYVPRPNGTQAVPTSGPKPVADPPTPAVRIQVRVPADAPPGDDIKYVITIRNVSSADAHKVAVRSPLSSSLEFVKADPPPTEPKKPENITTLGPATMTAPELVWSFGTLKPGETKTIELIAKPKQDATEVKNIAYVRFEHGETVTTKIHKPALKIAKNAPKQTVRDEPYKVSITLENTAKVPTANVRVTENVPTTAEIEPITKGAKKIKDGQWEWSLGTLHPGERRRVEYQITPRQVAATLTTTHVAADKSVLEKAEASTAVLVPALGVKLDGPSSVVGAGEAANFEITVRNTGTLPSSNVRVTAALPPDCRATKKTEGGQLFRDQIVWTIPRLEPGMGHAFRFGLKANSSGSRLVAVNVADARGTKSKDEHATVFQGAAALMWETIPEPTSVYVGHTGTFKVRVRNNGGDAARNVRVELELPPDIEVVQTTPNAKPVGRRMSFGPETIPPSGEAVYTVTYKATHPAEAWFKAKLSADALGEKPLQTEKMVNILGGSGV